MEQDRMTRLVIRRDLLLLLGYDAALLLRTDPHLDKGSSDVILLDKGTVFFGGLYRRFIQKIFEISPREACRRLRHLL